MPLYRLCLQVFAGKVEILINTLRDSEIQGKWKQEEFYVVLRNQFDLCYKMTDDSERFELINLDVHSLPVSMDTRIIEQNSQQAQKSEFCCGEHLQGTWMVDFKNVLWNINPSYKWKYEIIIDETDLVTLTLKAI